MGVVPGGSGALQAEVSIHLAAGHSCHGDREPCCPINSRASGAGGLVVLVVVVRGIESKALCVCVYMKTHSTQKQHLQWRNISHSRGEQMKRDSVITTQQYSTVETGVSVRKT